MKKVCLGLLLVGSLFGSNLALAQISKIVVFNIQDAIMNTDVAQAKIKEFEQKADFADLRSEYDSIVADMQKMQEDWQTNSVTWSDEQKEESQKNMEYKRADLEVVTKKLQNELQRFQVNIIREMEQKARTVLNDLIKSEGIGLALAKNQNIVLYADASYDITSKITDRLNKAE